MDDKVWMDVDRNIEGAIRTEYDSEMCAPGLAMSPAFSRGGGQVQRFADGSIYNNPAAKAASWLHGGIYDKYLALDGVNGFLGLPTTGIVPLGTPKGCGQVSCTKAEFDRGKIFDKGTAPPHEVHGKVLDYYLKSGGANGALGFPTSDVKHLAHGTIRSEFEHGVVTCPSQGRCTRQ
jgi:uncharacterized protein with LGFP repeats